MLDQKYFNGIGVKTSILSFSMNPEFLLFILGNYLRAEIIYRAKVDPFRSAADVLRSANVYVLSLHFDSVYPFPNIKQSIHQHFPMTSLQHRSADGDKVLTLCAEVPREVNELNLNKYGNALEKKKFNEWIKCYGKSNVIVDSQKRKFFYDPSQAEIAIIAHLR